MLDEERRAADDARQAAASLERKRVAFQAELEDVRALLETVRVAPIFQFITVISIVLLASVCCLSSGVCRRHRRLSGSVTLPAGGPAGRRARRRWRAGRWARRRSGGRHSTAGQYSYVPLG